MRVFLGRHGEASFNAPSDRERALTPNGVQATQFVQSTNQAVFSDVRHVLSSELVRARQTAEIYAEALGVANQTRTFLAPDYDAEEVLQALARESFDGDVLIVSHQPLVGDLMSLLVAGNIYDAHPYATSEMVALELDHWAAGCAKKLGEYRS